MVTFCCSYFALYSGLEIVTNTVANATKNRVLATKYLQLVTSGRLTFSFVSLITSKENNFADEKYDLFEQI